MIRRPVIMPSDHCPARRCSGQPPHQCPRIPLPSHLEPFPRPCQLACSFQEGEPGRVPLQPLAPFCTWDARQHSCGPMFRQPARRPLSPWCRMLECQDVVPSNRPCPRPENKRCSSILLSERHKHVHNGNSCSRKVLRVRAISSNQCFHNLTWETD